MEDGDSRVRICDTRETQSAIAGFEDEEGHEPCKPRNAGSPKAGKDKEMDSSLDLPERNAILANTLILVWISFSEVTQSCPTLCDPIDSTRLLRPWVF